MIVQHVPALLLRLTGAVNDWVGRLRGNAPFLGSDKVRDSLAGSWSMDTFKIRTKLGFAPRLSLRERLTETIRWYQAEGLLALSPIETGKSE